VTGTGTEAGTCLDIVSVSLVIVMCCPEVKVKVLSSPWIVEMMPLSLNERLASSMAFKRSHDVCNVLPARMLVNVGCAEASPSLATVIDAAVSFSFLPVRSFVMEGVALATPLSVIMIEASLGSYTVSLHVVLFESGVNVFTPSSVSAIKVFFFQVVFDLFELFMVRSIAVGLSSTFNYFKSDGLLSSIVILPFLR
jgi:hypothetical protein